MKKWEVSYTIRTKVNNRVFIVLHCLMVGIVWILSKNIFDWKYNFMKNAISTKLFAVGIISYDWNMISIKQTCMKIESMKMKVWKLHLFKQIFENCL